MTVLFFFAGEDFKYFVKRRDNSHFEILNRNFENCTKKSKCKKNPKETKKTCTQNIHMKKYQKSDKMDLYTDLSTLSTYIHNFLCGYGNKENKQAFCIHIIKMKFHG